MRSKKACPLAARIKKLMQADEDVGKIAQATPVLIGRAMELFLKKICEKSCEVAQSRQAKTISTSHLKFYVMSEEIMDFCKDVVAAAPDLAPEGEVAEVHRTKRRRIEETEDKQAGSAPSSTGRSRARKAQQEHGSATPVVLPVSPARTPAVQRAFSKQLQPSPVAVQAPARSAADIKNGQHEDAAKPAAASATNQTPRQQKPPAGADADPPATLSKSSASQDKAADKSAGKAGASTSLRSSHPLSLRSSHPLIKRKAPASSSPAVAALASPPSATAAAAAAAASPLSPPMASTSALKQEVSTQVGKHQHASTSQAAHDPGPANDQPATMPTNAAKDHDSRPAPFILDLSQPSSSPRTAEGSITLKQAQACPLQPSPATEPRPNGIESNPSHDHCNSPAHASHKNGHPFSAPAPASTSTTPAAASVDQTAPIKLEPPALSAADQASMLNNTQTLTAHVNSTTADYKVLPHPSAGLLAHIPAAPGAAAIDLISALPSSVSLAHFTMATNKDYDDDYDS